MGSPDLTRPISRRIAVARLAEAVIVADADVTGVRRGADWFTQDERGAIVGVVVTPDSRGRIAVGMHLVAYPPPRPAEELTAGLRQALFEAARVTGLAGCLGGIEVTIHDLVERPSARPTGRQPVR